MKLKKILTEIRLFVTASCNPAFWIQNYKFNRKVDNVIRTLIERKAPVSDNNSAYTTIVGGVMIWTSNYPYAYGRIRLGAGYNETDIKLRPSRRTIKLLREYIEAEQAKPTMDALTKIEEMINA